MTATSFVEIDNHPVGLVWREQAGYRFIAASQSLSAIDDRVFPSREAAATAARAVLAAQRERKQLRSRKEQNHDW